jgi:hypothetical protein
MDRYELSEPVTTRAHRQRKPGVEYKLRVIPGSDGLLELVEVPPPGNWFTEWARVMSLAGWTL